MLGFPASTNLSGGIIDTHLKLVWANPTSVSNVRHDGQTLHQLAQRLTQEIQSGRAAVAQTLAAAQNLSPFGVAVVATWMTRAGVSEAEILDVVA